MYFHLINLAVYTVFLVSLTICGLELMNIPLANQHNSNISQWTNSSLENSYMESQGIYGGNLVCP